MVGLDQFVLPERSVSSFLHAQLRETDLLTEKCSALSAAIHGNKCRHTREGCGDSGAPHDRCRLHHQPSWLMQCSMARCLSRIAILKSLCYKWP